MLARLSPAARALLAGGTPSEVPFASWCAGQPLKAVTAAPNCLELELALNCRAGLYGGVSSLSGRLSLL
jgi:hypothetical protein